MAAEPGDVAAPQLTSPGRAERQRWMRAPRLRYESIMWIDSNRFIRIYIHMKHLQSGREGEGSPERRWVSGGTVREGREGEGAEMGGSGAVLGLRAGPFTYVVHVLAAAAAVLVLVWCIHFRGGLAFESSNKSLIFNLHPVLMLIGFIIFGSEAIISYKALPWSKEVKKLIHLMLHAIAVVLGAVGIYTAFKFHNESGIVNLYSLHSWVGLGTICLYAVQWIFGFITFFFPGAAPTFRRDSLPWHVLFGLFVYVLTITTAELGFLEKLTFLENSGLYKYGSEAFLVNFTALVVVLLGAFVVLTAVSPAHVQDPHAYKSIPDA